MSKVKSQKPVFDPKKNYKWEPTDVFDITLTGQQFASLYHLVNQEMNVAGGATLGLKVDAHALVMDLFKDLIAEGLIVERVDDMPEVVEEEVHRMFTK